MKVTRGSEWAGGKDRGEGASGCRRAGGCRGEKAELLQSNTHVGERPHVVVVVESGLQLTYAATATAELATIRTLALMSID